MSRNIELCRSYGFTVGERQASVNPDFPGKFMVTDHEGWSIVGDDLEELANETVKTWELGESK